MATVFAAIAAAGGSGAAAGGVAAAGAATAATAATATTAAATTAAASTITLSQVLSAGSALAAIGQGFAANKQAKTQAEIANLQAEQETLQGATKARDIAKEYSALVSEQDAVQLANGLDIGIGTPVNVRKSTQKLAERDLSTARTNARQRSQVSRLRGRGLLSEGRASLLGGFGRAAAIGVDEFQLTG